ncbi:MAG: cadherin-like domain-containing protein, partial [Cyanobacteria bacterium CRU_2_1]|nr:cadherin-like domain-containing protein [Cyanobacteria bacterium CRU_2_1]
GGGGNTGGGGGGGGGVMNQPPIANNDTTTLERGKFSSIDVLSNDMDRDGTLNPASVTIVTQPSSGTVSVNAANGAITYTHNGNTATSDSFAYTVKDAAGATSNVASVAVAITATPSPTPTDPNGTFDTAFDLGTVPVFVSNANVYGDQTSPFTYTGDIGNTYNYGLDKDDYYKVTLSTSNYLAISISELSANAGIALYDTAGTLLYFANYDGADADIIGQFLNAGTYYARIYQNTPAATNYKLSMIAHSGLETGLAFNYDIGLLSNGDILTSGSGFGRSIIDSEDENDFYRFKVSPLFTGNSISVKLVDQSADADILVYDSAFELLGRSTNIGTADENVTLNASNGLKAGDTYYIQVNPFLDATPTYTVQVSG